MGLVAKSIRARSKVSVQPGQPRVDDWILAGRPSSYWASTRRPFPSLLLVAPMVIAYESGVLWLGGTTPGSLRTGADTWMRHALASLGLSDHWLLPLLLFLILLTWQVVSFYSWRFSPAILAGMVIESVVWAVVLLGISRMIDFGFSYLEQTAAPLLALSAVGDEPSISSLIGYLGAGVYEEALFRLILVPMLFAALRLLQTPQVLASALAVTGSALLFALAHHAGSPGEPFTWFAFVFRWMAGVFFAWVFILRGFGIAVGTHTIYDILVGWIAWRL
jgi:Type II CAAX prenyl endopeptidase Rce1-like